MMIPVAGRLMSKLSSPLASTLGMVGLTSGASVVGNMMSEEGREKPGGRIALEALGAGALGAGAGYGLSRLRDEVRNRGRQGVRLAKSSVKDEKTRALLDAYNQTKDPQFAQRIKNIFNNEIINDQNLIRDEMRNEIIPLTNAVGIAGGIIAGGAGGLLGGGIANAVGIPQSEPELPMAVRPALASQNVQQYLAGLQGAQGAPAMMIPVDA